MGATLTRAAPTASRRRDRLVALAPFAALGGWVVAMAALLVHFGAHNHYVFRDESNAIVLGREIVHQASLALSGSVARGPERLTSWLAALAALPSDEPTPQIERLHVLTAICQALVAVPVWLAARELRLGRWQALVPAAVATSGSFAFYGVLTLNTSVGMLCATAMLWAAIRALRRPGLASDLLVVATLGATVLARIGWAPLVAALVPAALATAWLDRPAGEPARAWLRALPRRLARRHPVLLPVALLLLAVALAAGPSVLLGGHMYGGIRLTPNVHWPMVRDDLRTLGLHLALGVAIVPLVLALPLLARGLVRPTDPLEGGYAWLVLGLFAIFFYAYVASLNEDRYLAVLAPPIVLAGALAVFRRPPRVRSVLVSAALVTLLVGVTYATPSGDPFGLVIEPTLRFFDNVVVGKLTLLVSVDRAVIAIVLAALAGLAAACVASVARARRSGPAIGAAAAVLVALLAYQLAATDHAARKFTALEGMPSYTAANLEFLDRAIGSGSVRPLAVDGAVDPDVDAQLPFLSAYNHSLDVAGLVVRSGPAPAGAPEDVAIDWRSGRTAVRTGLPTALLELAGTAPVGFAGTSAMPSPQFPWAQVVRLRTPLRTLWVLRGTQPDRYPLRGTPVEVRTFPDGAHRCLSGAILAYPLQPAPVAYRLDGAGRSLRGVALPGRPVPFSLPLPAARPVTVTLRGQARRGPDGIWRGPTLSTLGVGRCAG